MIRFVALPTDIADAYRRGAPDANGQTSERRSAETSGLPCRHCLSDVTEGEERYPQISDLPAAFLVRAQMMMRGYNSEQRIVYGTGAVVPTHVLVSAAAPTFEDSDISFIHVRSASNGCFQCLIEAV